MSPSTPKPKLHHDWEDWLPYLEQSDATPEQKRALIEALWSIVLCFVDLGWDVSDASESCGEPLDLKAALEAAMLNSKPVSDLQSGSGEEDAA